MKIGLPGLPPNHKHKVTDAVVSLPDVSKSIARHRDRPPATDHTEGTAASRKYLVNDVTKKVAQSSPRRAPLMTPGRVRNNIRTMQDEAFSPRQHAGDHSTPYLEGCSPRSPGRAFPVVPTLRIGMAELHRVETELLEQESDIQHEMDILHDRQHLLIMSSRSRLPQSATRYITPEEVRFEVIQCAKEEVQLEKEMHIAKRQEARVCKLKQKQQKADELRRCTWLAILCLANSVPQFEGLHRTRGAQHVLGQMMLPLLLCRLRVKQARVARRLLTGAAAPHMTKPSVADLAKTKLFLNWPGAILGRLRRSFRAVVFRAGEFVVMQGDPGALMYIIDSGAVEILIHSAGDSKKRTSAIPVATLGPGAYFGEFTILVDEPRMASVRATATTRLWSLHKQAVQFWISKLPEGLQRRARQAAEERRRANMYKLVPLTPRHLVEVPIFQMWSPNYHQLVIDKCKPVIFDHGQVLMEEGAPGDYMYFLGRGEVKVFLRYRDPGRQQVAALKPPSAVGEIALLFKEVRCATVVAVNVVECWALSMADFQSLMLSFPQWFLAAKGTMNVQRAAWLPQIPLQTVMQCGLLPHGFRTKEQARQLLALMHPRVYDTTSTITFANAEIVEVLFCLNGRFGGSGAEGGGGAVLGVEEAAAGRTGWPLTLRAHTRVDMWALPMESLRAHIKSNEKLRSAFCKGIPQAMARGFGVESEWAVVNAPPKSRALS